MNNYMVILYDYKGWPLMDDIEISVSQGKKEFTKIIRDASQSDGNVIIPREENPPR